MLITTTPLGESDHLKSYRMVAGATVFETVFPEFSVDDLTAALFKSSYGAPKTLPIWFEGAVAQVVVDKVEAVWVQDAPEPPVPGETYAYHENPDWFVEGWVEDRALRVRAYVMAGAADDISSIYIQRIPPTPDLEGHVNLVSYESEE
ncbi:hypothetical protein [Streptomyces sp. DvalAA-19]|uniref:hypothetical protein n=1 Tax=Streptomyces sp. DvalAA-19 TaxID=1839761 RepID=UPI00081B03FC|nr:hypothetical protein [Streptomyces sp. DvalAA-19]SCE05965.1 hypothetical protein GA0115244_116141 [Streptomyces sp. DvalAA-19]